MTIAPEQPIDLRKATPGEVPGIANALARAFFADPVFRWIYPDAEERRGLVPGFFEVFAKAYQAHEETYVSGEVTGAALWAPPEQSPVGDEENQRLGPYAGSQPERFVEIGKLFEEHHPEGSYYYLQFMGVEPASQGRGIGSALLANMLERVDREGARAYLDATSPDNKRLYERHGFRATGEFAPKGGPTLWPMWREPRTPGE